MWWHNVILLVAALLTATNGRSTFSSDLPTHLRQMKNVHDDGGVPWMLIPDDEVVRHLAILIETSPLATRDVAEDVQLNLYTNLDGGSNPYRLRVNDIDNLNNSGYNPEYPTKILIHGFGGDGQNVVVIGSKDAYLAKGNYNVIGVDWSVLSAAPNYITAWMNSGPTGAHIAELIEFLVAKKGARLEDFHIIGQSLGGQVAGFVGSNTITGKVGRITGLDSAYPMFGNAEPDGRLDPTDAILVDAIHTAGGTFGFREPYGHVDFFPNGGTKSQPGCEDEDATGGCSHIRAADYFIYSIKEPDAFPSIECLTLEEAESEACTGNATAFMGDSIRFDTYGLYYLNTSNVPA